MIEFDIDLNVFYILSSWTGIVSRGWRSVSCTLYHSIERFSMVQVESNEFVTSQPAPGMWSVMHNPEDEMFLLLLSPSCWFDPSAQNCTRVVKAHSPYSML